MSVCSLRLGTQLAAICRKSKPGIIVAGPPDAGDGRVQQWKCVAAAALMQAHETRLSLIIADR